MYVHEPEYVEYTTHYYFAKDEGEAYTSVSNMVYLVLCVADRHYDGVKFRINYQIAGTCKLNSVFYIHYVLFQSDHVSKVLYLLISDI